MSVRYVMKLRSGAFIKDFVELKSNGDIVITERALDVNNARFIETESEVKRLCGKLPPGIEVLIIDKED